MILAVDLDQPGQEPLAPPQCRVGLARRIQDPGHGPLAAPFQRTREQITRAVRGQQFQNGHGRQLFGVQIVTAAAFQLAFGLQFLQQAFQLDPLRALDAEGFRDVAFGIGVGMVRNPIQDLLLVG